MNVANKDLCAELYELSGWQAGYMDWYYDKYVRRTSPMYNLGYLLRKLPNSIEGERPDDSMYTSLTINTDGSRWRAYYEEGFADEDDQMLHFNTADTPEDAACKLAIELFKQGVLVKEGK